MLTFIIQVELSFLADSGVLVYRSDLSKFSTDFCYNTSLLPRCFLRSFLFLRRSRYSSLLFVDLRRQRRFISLFFLGGGESSASETAFDFDGIGLLERLKDT